jgi:fructokinase
VTAGRPVVVDVDGGLRTTFVVAGEALIDLIQQPDGRLAPKPGGSSWNLARALGRLGRHVRFVSPLSSDGYGRMLAQALIDSGVDVAGAQSALPTSLALVKIDAQGHPDYAFYRDGVADRDLDPLTLATSLAAPGTLFHVGSLALIPPDAAAWLMLLKRLVARGLTTSVDINMRPMVARDEAARAAYAAMAPQLLAQGRIVKVSDEDLRAMGRTGDPLDEAAALLGDVTALVVLTLGARGAWCLARADGGQGSSGTAPVVIRASGGQLAVAKFSGRSDHGDAELDVLHAVRRLFQPPATVPVIDTVGAGDCFYAGFLARLDEQGALTPGDHPFTVPSDAALTDALAFASRVAAFNLQRTGCQPPWRTAI